MADFGGQFNYDITVCDRRRPMANIDPLYFITPIVVIAFSAGLVLYWALRRRFKGSVLVYSLAAYAGAIALKYAIQIPTISWFRAATGGSLAALGFYYGAQTALFEVGGAYLVASYAVRRGKLEGVDAEGFGIGLAFWENGVLLAIPLLFDYAIYYLILSTPTSSAAQTLYGVLSTGAPSLFYGPGAALPLIGYSILERISSFMAHMSWGILTVVAVVTRRRTFFVAAIPLGFVIDFLVPFAGRMGLAAFELLMFGVSAVWLVATLAVTSSARTPAAAAEKGQPF